MVTGRASHQDYLLETLLPSVDLAALVDTAPERYPYLLESVAHGGAQGRYDLLMLGVGNSLLLGADGSLSGGCDDDGRESMDFLGALDHWAAAESVAPQDGRLADLPFRSGWFLFLAYDLARQVEPTLDIPFSSSLPVAQATEVAGVVIRDHVQGTVVAVVEEGRAELLTQLRGDLSRSREPADVSLHSIEEEQPQRYLDAVARTIRYIEDGDVFQANLSRRWQGRLAGEPVDLYRRLCRSNPGPFAGIARIGERWIISSSPERLIEIRSGVIQTRPIAGTRPRGDDEVADRALMAELIEHPKERAEHVMLIDLERNDLGRVCQVGTVEVDEMMGIESYAHVHHIVSNVRGELRHGVGPGSAIRAVFPGGTITGCPKVRCMEIIQEMEGEARSAYTGSIGYLDRCGDMDLNILIRTLELEAGEFTLRAGAGIVADSEPKLELDETRAKARGLLHALGATEGAAS
jgi:4-amino-4-deoxychorismate synthase (2-amino-4-deoxychorismate-forming) component I